MIGDSKKFSGLDKDIYKGIAICNSLGALSCGSVLVDHNHSVLYIFKYPRTIISAAAYQQIIDSIDDV